MRRVVRGTLLATLAGVGLCADVEGGQVAAPNVSSGGRTRQSVRTTLMVDNTVPCDDGVGSPHCTVGSALAAAVPGDRILVVAGTYRENLVVSTPNLLVEGGPGQPEIDGGDGAHAFLVLANRVWIRGFVVRGSQDDGIRAEDVRALALTDNVIRHNVGDGIELRMCSDFDVAGNDVIGNVNDGLHMQGCELGMVSDNLFFGNGLEGVGGFDFLLGIGCDDMVYDSNHFLENGKHGIIHVGDGNLFVENTSTRSGFEFPGLDFEGFHITGDLNHLLYNDSVESGGEGYQIEGFGNRAENNRAWNSALRGFLVMGDFNELVWNDSELSGGGCVVDVDEPCDHEGFYVLGSDNDLRKNTALQSASQGFVVEGARNRLSENDSLQNGSHGFEIVDLDLGVVPSVGNELIDNESADNGGFGYADPTTGSGTAGTANKYSDNTSQGDALGASNPVGLGD